MNVTVKTIFSVNVKFAILEEDFNSFQMSNHESQNRFACKLCDCQSAPRCKGGNLVFIYSSLTYIYFGLGLNRPFDCDLYI